MADGSLFFLFFFGGGGAGTSKQSVAQIDESWSESFRRKEKFRPD